MDAQESVILFVPSVTRGACTPTSGISTQKDCTVFKAYGNWGFLHLEI